MRLTIITCLIIPFARAFVPIPLTRAFVPTRTTLRKLQPQTSFVAPKVLCELKNAAVEEYVLCTSTLLAHENNAFLAVLGSSAIMFLIVGLLYLWEESVEWARKAVGESLRPVVESILAEIGGLGFIGLILQTFAPANREFLEEISIKLFGEGEVLIETFEFLHNAFFQVGVGFFVAVGAMVAVGLKKLGEIETIEELQVDKASGACTVTAQTLKQYLPVVSKQDELPEENLFDEIIMSTEERAGKVLLMRSRLVEKYNPPDTFRIEKYIQGAFAENLLEMVEISPLTWIYLIPALALANSIDLSHEVINANSPNAFESSGFFFSTPWAILPSIFTVVLSFIWGVWNCWKMTEIKYMLLPRLGRNSSSTEQVEIMPPPIDVDQLLDHFDSSPFWIRPIEALWAKPAVTRYDRLFGTAGAAGLDLYRNSIKIQSWLCITHIVFFGTQIVPRDLDAVLSGAPVGAPEYLNAELLTYGSFVILSLLQLILVSPRAFWNLCLVACVEDGVSQELLEASVVSNET